MPNLQCLAHPSLPLVNQLHVTPLRVDALPTDFIPMYIASYDHAYLHTQTAIMKLSFFFFCKTHKRCRENIYSASEQENPHV